MEIRLQSPPGFGCEDQLSLPEGPFCDVDMSSLPFQFCHLLLLAFTITQCWRRDPNVSAGVLGEVFMKLQYIQGELSTTKEGVKLSKVHLSFRESGNATHH